ncbi:structural maintenance of chromosomes protein 1A-like [Uloborus diversus]|uniref:structural maintenance of chromosomes protein 1A-like n=1 Tax=Uloborus diversus TaxID=327109 RepID=UPI00240A096D|nr:structural maintenance of chromosomes protein 1A-like [Uloborus diversus]
MGFLKCIEVENFKSYRGKQEIGVLKPFTAIIGPNGSGKSNFMDAISFVLGEKTSCLRVKKLSELIHGAPIGAPVSNRAHVTAIYCNNDKSETHFTRLVIGSSSEYRIDGKSVGHQDYTARLEGLGINVKAKNFLVFQGAVESIAMKSPKERTALFEEISHSIEHKEEYDRLKTEMMKAEEDTQFTYQKKKGIAAEKKEARLEKEEAEKYQRLKEDLASKQVLYYLFKLYHNEEDIKNLGDELSDKNKELEKASRKREKIEEEIKEKKKEHGKLQREFSKIEQQIREAEVELNKKKPTYIKAKERTAHMQKKLETAKKSLKAARKVHESHEGEIKTLEAELADVVKAQEEFERELQKESQSEGRDITLQNSQVEEYNRLKEEAGKLSSIYLQKLDSINREQKSDQDRCDNEIRKKAEVESKIKQKRSELEENTRRLEKLAEYIKTSESGLSDLRSQEKEIGKEVQEAKKRVADINEELESILNELGDAKVDKHEDSRRRKKAEIVDHFKRLFPGVYDRLVNMCQPIHKRYNVAITKVLGKNMEAIVVDTERTGRSCIQYLKEQMLEAETFLPLDYIDAKPLKERLRNIHQPKNVKLLYDVLQYDPPAIKRAVLYATNNALVCETAEDANKVAYELGDNKRYDAVALDGTYYQKNGFISGGSTDLAKRARRWDEKALHNLKYRKEKLTEELKEMMKKTRKESDLTTIQSQIRGLETRLKYSITDKENTEKRVIAGLEKEIAALERELNTFEPKINDLEDRMKEREGKIQEVKESMNTVEDRVFADFCKSIGVENIRQYEERELRASQEREKKRLEFENQKNRITNRLEYEKSKDTSENVKKWTKTVDDDEKELEKLKKAETTQMQLIDEDMQNLEKLKNTKISKKAEVDKIDESTAEIRKRLATAQKDITSVQKQVTSLETKLEQKKADRHSLFQTCKLEDIKIPMKKGSMDDIDHAASSQQDDVDLETSGNQSTQRIYEKEAKIVLDYSDLEEDLKELDTNDEIKKEGDRLNKEVNDMLSLLKRIQAPNMKAMEKLDGVKERLKETDTEFENARRRAKKSKQTFEKVKRERYDKFMKCFDHVSNRIDEIYKALTNNQSAQAFLGPENPEEPYLEGLNYNCVAPGKRFQPMSNLSGGEKTVAALALLFSVHSYQPAPFFVLDEIDAALDNTNIGKVARFIREQTETSFQCIVISLKEEFYGHADSLVGIVPDPGECTISRVLTWDLTQYEE